MGVNVEEAKAILALRRSGAIGDDILCLGRPEIFGAARQWSRLARDFGLGWSARESRAIAGSRYADGFLRAAGFKTVRSLDASAYEGADIVHDLNLPIPDALRESAGLVYDGGTIEHVFDVARAMRNVMELLRVGGVALMSSPANGQCGHGFYQFSPELFYRLFSANGFEDIQVFLVGLQAPARWYRATDPRAAGARIQFSTGEPMQAILTARKARRMDEFVTPQQSDYADAQWDASLAGEAAPRREWTSPAAVWRARLRDRIAFPLGVGLRAGLGLGMPGLWRSSHFRCFDPAKEALAPGRA